ncbi:MAG: hypothetical protein LAT68_14440 [Cyclobacteriaceae bacterium]|nr:hypothetical protein [Cyclobacteriaceae bacterium]MCH8517519.1 hypothetical protein [Cyclobacteriaceae bacterium]
MIKTILSFGKAKDASFAAFLFLLSLLFALPHKSSAQTLTELFTTPDYVANEIWTNGSFGEESDFSFFNFTRFRVLFGEIQPIEFISYTIFTYQLGNGFGLSAGGFALNNVFNPILSVNYFYSNEVWVINFFPAIILQQKPDLDVFNLIQFRPYLSDHLRLFSQLITINNFNFRNHNFIEQTVRLGLERSKFQFGIGFDWKRSNTELVVEARQSIGLFMRKEF